MNEQRSHWDLKYEQGLPSLERPDPFFLSAFDQFVASSFPNGGTALDLAGGIGRHALWLAKRNWQVTVVNISEVAIHKLGQSAQQLDLTLNLLALDARDYSFEPAFFDLVVMFYHLDRDICPQVLSTLKPGGFLICKSSVCWDSYEGIAPANFGTRGPAPTGTKEKSAEADELSLAKQLINGRTSRFDLSEYKDDYEAAVKKLVEAKRKGKPLPEEEPETPRPKVVNIMDALPSRVADSKPRHKVLKKSTRGRKAA